MWYSLPMKTRNLLIIAAIITICLFAGQAQAFADSDELDLSGESAVLMNLEDGEVLYEKNAREIRDPASLTKILTLMIVLDTLDMDQEVTVPDSVDNSGTSIYLVPGEKLTVEELVYGMMLKSGNDAAQILALEAGDSQEHFSEMMNARAKECGAEDTDFKNPNGMNEDPNALNWTTAYDLALITREAMKDERYREIVATKKYTIPATNKSEERVLKNSNVCIRGHKMRSINGEKRPLKYEGCTGGKTGHSSTAGYCFMGTAKRDNMELVGVSLHASGYSARYIDVIKMWDYGFDHFKTYTAVKGGDVLGSQKVRGGSLSEVDFGVMEDMSITVAKDDEVEHNIATSTKLYSKELTAPISKGDVVGIVEACDEEGNVIATADLCALEDVDKGWILSRFGVADEDAGVYILMFSALVILILIIVIIVRLRRGKSAKDLN